MRLYAVWAALLACLAVTFASAFFPLGGWNSAVNMVISALKAVLIAVFFMELGRAGALLRLAAVTGLLWLALLFGLSWTDFATRPHGDAPWAASGTSR